MDIGVLRTIRLRLELALGGRMPLCSNVQGARFEVVRLGCHILSSSNSPCRSKGNNNSDACPMFAIVQDLHCVFRDQHNTKA